MKTIQLLGAAGAISIAAGGHPDDTAGGGGNSLRGVDALGDDPTPAFHNATCDLAAGELPCHNEVGWIITCAPPDGDCPCFFNEERCRSPRFGAYCDTVCCEWRTQERCRAPDPDDPGISVVWCAEVDEGGCPCDDGEVKCGVMEVDGGHSGYCTTLCCGEGEQTCYDDNYDASSCALIEEGGCPCPEGQVKCGGTDDWAGYCTETCCDPTSEETCYGANGAKTCRKIAEGGCTAHTSHRHWESRVASTILSEGSGGQVSYYASIRERREVLRRREGSAVVDVMMTHLEAEEAALFHAIRTGRSKKHPREDESVPSFLEEIASIF